MLLVTLSTVPFAANVATAAENRPIESRRSMPPSTQQNEHTAATMRIPASGCQTICHQSSYCRAAALGRQLVTTKMSDEHKERQQQARSTHCEFGSLHQDHSQYGCLGIVIQILLHARASSQWASKQRTHIRGRSAEMRCTQSNAETQESSPARIMRVLRLTGRFDC